MSEPNFHQFLTDLPAVNQLVAGRVYPDQLRPGTSLPAVVYSKSGAVRQKKLCGTDGLVLGSFQLDVYGATRQAVRELATRIVGSGRRGQTPPDALLDYKGLMGVCYVKDCSLSNDFDAVDPEPGYFRRVQLWDIWYVERE